MSLSTNWDNHKHEMYVRVPIDNQTMEMAFQEFDTVPGQSVCFNVCLSIFNKRKHKERNEDLHLSTGKDPIRSIMLAIQAFDDLEAAVLDWYDNYQTITIFVSWVDNRRRDAYYKVLSKRGYQYGMFWNKKYLYKKFERKEDGSFEVVDR